MVDRTTKALLLAIALGLWANFVGTWMRAVPVEAAQASNRKALAFVDYAQLVDEKEKQNWSASDIQILLLTHIAGNTAVK